MAESKLIVEAKAEFKAIYSKISKEYAAACKPAMDEYYAKTSNARRKFENALWAAEKKRDKIIKLEQEKEARGA